MQHCGRNSLQANIPSPWCCAAPTAVWHLKSSSTRNSATSLSSVTRATLWMRKSFGSIEYAVEHLETPLVVVMGHASCGAVTATCQGDDLPGHILDLVKRIRPSINTSCCIDGNAKRHAKRMAQLIEEDEIVHHVGAKVVAAFYNLESGQVEWL